MQIEGRGSFKNGGNLHHPFKHLSLLRTNLQIEAVSPLEEGEGGRSGTIGGGSRGHAFAHHLCLLVLPHGDPPFEQDHLSFLQKGHVFGEGFRKYDDFDGAV